jgi:hypothetical protein
MRASANVDFTPEQQATIKAGNPHGHEASSLGTPLWARIDTRLACGQGLAQSGGECIT